MGRPKRPYKIIQGSLVARLTRCKDFPKTDSSLVFPKWYSGTKSAPCFNATCATQSVRAYDTAQARGRTHLDETTSCLQHNLLHVRVLLVHAGQAIYDHAARRARRTQQSFKVTARRGLRSDPGKDVLDHGDGKHITRADRVAFDALE